MTRRRRARRLVAAALTAAVAVAGTTSAAAVEGGSSASADELSVGQSSVSGGASHPLRLKVLSRQPEATPMLTSSTPGGYTPAKVRSYLGLTGTGSGQTIAIVTAYDAPNAAKDLAVFNSTFSLPAPPSFRKVNQTGGTKLPAVDASWALEAALDVQWAHAVAPAAGILLVEATTNSPANLMAAVSWAAAQPGVSVVSGSWGFGEWLRQKDHDARCKLTTGACVFATGDTGNPPSYPATAPWTLGVGGTTLSLDGGAVLAETAWSGSGGGVSLYTAKPAWQSALPHARRSAPDVSYAGDPNTGFAVYSSTPYLGQSGWFQMGGTSAGAPQWAGILAATNSLRKAAGKPVLSAVTSSGATPLHTALYGKLAGSAVLGDVILGTNGTCGAQCTAGPGYDTVTGHGSPRRGLDVALRDAV